MNTISSLSDAAKALRESYEKWHTDGKLFYDAPDVSSLQETYCVRNYQIPSNTERISIGKSPYLTRQSVISRWNIWTKAAIGPEKHFSLFDSIISYIYTHDHTGLIVLNNTTVPQSLVTPPESSEWLFTDIHQIFYIDIPRRLS